MTHTLSELNAWWQVDLGQVQSINTIKVWNRVEFPERLTSFYVFVSDVPFTSTNLTTTQNQAGVSSYYTAGQCGFPTELAINRTGRYIRVQLAGTNYLSIAELQVLGTAAPSNVALNKTATQSSTHSSGAVASRAVDGNTDGVFANNSVTSTLSELNAWWHVDLGQVETIGTIKLWNRVEFPERLTNFYVFVSDVPFTSTNLTTTLNQAGVSSYQTTGQCGFPTELTINRSGRYVRVQLAGTNYLSIAEVQVWTGSTTPHIQWLISDHLGTPRMILDHTGSLANVKRHDYLPFGEELFEPAGGRSAALGYTSGDGVRQQFTSKERDVETALDYFGARYYLSTQGRFVSADPLLASAEKDDPQTWNRYAYVTNHPLRFTDPTGERRNPVTGRRGIDPNPRNGTLGGVRANGQNPHVGEWGMTRNGGTKGHFGTDITAPIGTNLVAVESGRVTEVKTTPKGGLQVYVKMANGTVYKYFHLDSVSKGIGKGTNVQEGQVIAVSGNSGNAKGLTATNEDHVHLTVIDANGANVNPVEWLNDPNADAPVDVLSTTGTPPPTPITVPAGNPNQQTITGPNGSVTVQQQPLPLGQAHKHKPPR